MNYLKISAYICFLLSLLHIVIAFFLGADGYRLFGAGEEFAVMEENGLSNSNDYNNYYCRYFIFILVLMHNLEIQANYVLLNTL